MHDLDQSNVSSNNTKSLLCGGVMAKRMIKARSSHLVSLVKKLLWGEQMFGSNSLLVVAA